METCDIKQDCSGIITRSDKIKEFFIAIEDEEFNKNFKGWKYNLHLGNEVYLRSSKDSKLFLRCES